METRSFSVPASNVVRVEKKVNALNKRAAKLNLTPLSYVVGESSFRDYTDENGSKWKVEFKAIEVSGEVPSLNGWAIVAGIDHVEGVNLIRSFEDVPVEYRERKPFCDHCNTHKIKVKSTIIKNVESGEFKQVGNSCLKDFIARDVSGELSYFELMNSFFTEIDEMSDEFFGGAGSAPAHIEVGDVFAAAFGIIDNYGFEKADGMYPTKFVINSYFFGNSKYDKEMREEITLKDFEEKGLEVIDWVVNNTSNNDFFYTLKSIVSMGFVLPKYFGYIAGAVAAFNRAKTESVAKEARLNEYLDVPVKKRVEIPVVLKRVVATDGYYGTTYIHTFYDADGRNITWFANGTRVDSEEGDSLTIKATVKAFKSYNETKQTIVTRVAVV